MKKSILLLVSILILATSAEAQFGIGADGFFNIIGIDETVLVERDEIGLDPLIPDQLIDRPDDGIMFDVSGDNMVPRFQRSLYDKIQGIGGVV